MPCKIKWLFKSYSIQEIKVVKATSKVVLFDDQNQMFNFELLDQSK